jgi:hypothetical protein
MPGTTGFTMAAFKAEDVPVGTRLYIQKPVILSQEEHDMLKDVLRSFLTHAGNGSWYVDRMEFMENLISRTIPNKSKIDLNRKLDEHHQHQSERE